MAPPSATPDQRPARNGRRAAIHYARKAPLMDPSQALQTTLPRPPPKRTRRPPRRTLDPNGNPIVLVPMPGGAVAVLDAPDYDRLAALDLVGPFYLNTDGKGRAYVKVRLRGPGGNLVMAARLILDTPAKQVIRYADGNPLHLRRSNLVFGQGASKRREQIAKSDGNTEGLDF